jgi:hypothetical protein
VKLIPVETIPAWLPPLVSLEDSRGNWYTYLTTIYNHYLRDFVERQPRFEGDPVSVRYHPAYEGKGATFWHIISEGSVESERTPDLRRCERIRWPRPMIEKANSLTDVAVWEAMKSWRKQLQRRVYIALSNFSYLVAIGETSRGFDLITAFYLEKKHEREKLRREYESFLSQKKGGTAL